MKTKLLFCLLLSAIFSKAQYVTIPDSNFRNALKSYDPSIFIGDKVVSQLAENISSVYVDDSRIESLEGIQYFKNLTSLSCEGNLLTVLPELPSRLTSLYCGRNQLTALPELPSSLTLLYCFDNALTSLPQLPLNLIQLNCYYNYLTGFYPFLGLPSLPNSLQEFTCYGNKLTSLPDLPSSLLYLSCGGNQLTTLPELPSSLTSLDCASNYLYILPELPSGLTYLECSSNQLSILPVLPNGLKRLYCSSNKLSVLPVLPNGLSALICTANQLTSLDVLPTSLTHLGCGNNKIISLPSLPSGLTSLWCNHNLLTSLPVLPFGLGDLVCSNNQLTSLPVLPSKLTKLSCDINSSLTCLPFLPSTLRFLYVDNTKITCIPNKPSSLSTTLSLCSPTTNKNNCEAFPIISGLVFNDINKNGIKETNEFPKKGIKITLQPSGQFTFTNNAGYYEIAVDTLQTYTISAEVPAYFSVASQMATTTFTREKITRDFALKATKNFKDLSATLTPLTSFVRPGFSFPLLFEVENRGTTTEYGTAYVDFPSDYILDSTSINSVNGNFNFTDLHSGESIKMMVYGRLATTATLGDTLKIRGIVNIYDYGSDSLYSNNISEVKMLIRGSFDPNDKQGPETVTPKQVQNGEFIEYTIRFQNTGTDTAFTVVVADTLTSNLLPETLEMISTSHNCKTTVKGNQVYFEFLNILLPDSNTNEARSHGYVRFKVKPKNTLKLGQSILNTASIYFDYNKPVVTNTVNTKIDEPLLTGIQTVSISNNGLAYPNPVENGRLFVSNARGLKYKLINTQGQLMMNGTIDETGLDVSKLNSGMYMLEIKANENSKVEKIVIR